jgi:hypothetical protein
MELDDFKAFYQAHFELVPNKSGPVLEEMLRKRSHTAIERILRNLLWEVGAALFIMLVLAVVMVSWPSTIFRWVGGSLVIVSVVQVVLFIGQYRQLRDRLNCPPGSVRHYLQEMEAIISRFVRIYYRFCMGSIPVGLLLGGFIGATEDASDPAFSALPEKPTIFFTVVCLLLSIGLVMGTYFMLKWYIHQLYGRYLDELRACIAQLE